MIPALIFLLVVLLLVMAAQDLAGPRHRPTVTGGGRLSEGARPKE